MVMVVCATCYSLLLEGGNHMFAKHLDGFHRIFMRDCLRGSDEVHLVHPSFLVNLMAALQLITVCSSAQRLQGSLAASSSRMR